MKPTHAGAVVFRIKDGELRFLVIASSNGRHWVLPKGHIEPGESSDVAALREMREEAGIAGEIVKTLSIQKFHKLDEDAVAQYYLVRQLDAFAAAENRILRWEDESTALKLLSFEEARKALYEGTQALRQMKQY